MRCLANGEAVSVDGTHLGHNLPDKSGNRCVVEIHVWSLGQTFSLSVSDIVCRVCRYCINLVSVAGSGERSSTTGPAGDGL